MRANKVIPRDLEGEGSILEEWWHNGASVEGQKTCVNDKYDPWLNNCKHREERQENKRGSKKSYAIVQYSKFMKGKDRAGQYHNYYSVLKKTVKWSKKWYCIC